MTFVYRLLRNKYLIGLILFISLAVVFEKNMRIQPDEKIEFDNIQKIINHKTEKVDQILDKMELALDSLNLNDLMINQEFGGTDLLETEGIIFLGYSGDSLLYWTDNSIPVGNYSIDKQLYNNFEKLKNGWYVIRQNTINNYKLFGLILIKKEYTYQNEFIKNDFFYEYKSEIPTSLVLDENEGFKINDWKGNYLFSFRIKSNFIYNNTRVILSSIFYFLGLILLLLLFKSLIHNRKSAGAKNILLLCLVVALVLFRYLMQEFHFPDVFRRLELFQPHHFAISFIPSLGDLLLHSLFIFFFFIVFYSEFNVRLPKNILIKNLYLSSFIFFAFALFFGIHFLFGSLIQHSSISFSGHRFFDLSIYSLIGFITIVFLLASFFLFIDRILNIIKNEISLRHFSILFITIFFLVFFLNRILQLNVEIYSFCFLLIVVLYLAYFRINNKVYSYPIRVIILLIFALYTVAFISVVSKKKDNETRKVLAVNLANEHDQIAEMLLESVESQIENDTIVRDLLTWHSQNVGAILDHLQSNYFSGYFRKYELEISVCNPYDDLTVNFKNSTEIVQCYDFFDFIIREDGSQLQNSRFYFLDNTDGRIGYLGQFIFDKPEWNNEVSLFVSLKSKLISQELGYPELLLNSRMKGSAILNDYSYAKYKNGSLMAQSGDFSYQLVFPEEWNSKEEFFFSNDQSYEHLIYNIDETTSVVISNVKFGFVDFLASFSYVFVFYIILYTIMIFFIFFPENIKGFNYDFKNKIKFSMIGVLLLSLIVVGTGTIKYSINQFEKNLYGSIGEKIQSVLVEMKDKLGGEFELNQDYNVYLNYLLDKFANVFNIDINLYDVNGNLLASSRLQIFEKGLMSKKMDVDAYRQMVINKSGKYIHIESIGELSFYSAYVPFTNDENELLAYLNLPYFTKQSALKKEIYTIVVAVVNIYFFLILISVIVAIFVSNNITRPLQLIQEKFRAIDLGKKNEPISYSSRDEIGSLIKEYNRMVSELTENAKKLAKSERESAWREMAKQIAHEIKNPLTPMKLSVQYLQKAWKDENPDFDKRLEKFSNSLISQINNLSSIATEFSNFAKMPGARAEEVDLIAKLNDSVNLLEQTGEVSFVKDFQDMKELFVYADKEQLLIVFSNLLQNGIQAVPKERKAEIKLKVEKQKEFVKVTIKDNGRGIPDDLKDKLFIPNFTTKTSGMGLGLAIVKNIIVNAGGEIGYETELNKGTTFYVTFPLYKKSE
ncbi:MAG: GHKL domain-containing protein [Bacteroidales bacterium]|nr:GHKL domain-containing protein [Bacteroidales bacterium]